MLGANVIGATLPELELAREQFRAMLKDGAAAPDGRFSDLSMLAPVKDYPARHASTLLMKAIPGAVAKGGAEGLICGTLPNGIGFAAKCEDGHSRALRPALARLLEAVGTPLPGFAEVPIANSRGERVGTIAAL